MSLINKRQELANFDDYDNYSKVITKIVKYLIQARESYSYAVYLLVRDDYPSIVRADARDNLTHPQTLKPFYTITLEA